MPITMVLAIGLDSAVLESQRNALKAAGYFVTCPASIGVAIEEFRDGDYDLVLVGQSIEADKRERLTLKIRETGSRVPVVCVGEPSTYFDALAAALAESASRYAILTAGDLMANRKKPVARASVADTQPLQRAS